MFKVELNGKTYKIEKVTAKALREIGAAQAVFKRWQENPDAVDMKKDMDALVGWFCVLCGNQFTADEYYDHYPADRCITDIGLAIAAVNAQVTHVLESFPTSGDSKKKHPRRLCLAGLLVLYRKRADAGRNRRRGHPGVHAGVGVENGAGPCRRRIH